MIKTKAQLVLELALYPDDAKICTTYSEDISSGKVEVLYYEQENTIQIVGSADDI